MIVKINDKEYEAEAFSIGKREAIIYNGKVERIPIAKIEKVIIELNTNACPKCKNRLVIQEGCEHCLACGYSACAIA